MPAAEKLQAPASAGAPRNGNVPPSALSRDRGLFNRAILAHAAVDALKKFDPRVQLRNPVMFVVLIGTMVTFAESVAHPGIFAWSVTAWLALTVLFANFAQAVAEGARQLTRHFPRHIPGLVARNTGSPDRPA